MICREDDLFVSFLYDEPGKRKMIEHMNTQHGETFTMDYFDED